MKSTNAIMAALASTAMAQPHAHQHAHLHPARMEHQHLHDKRVLETEIVVEWVTETVVEMIEGTTTEWVTEGATADPTTFATVIASTTSEAGQFFETASTSTASSTTTPVPVAQPVETTSTSSSSVYVAPTTEPTTSTSSYIAPVEPTSSTTSTEAPVVVAPTSTTTSEAAAAAATTTTAAAASSASGSSSISGTDFSGKITWIGETTGAYSACGVLYEQDSMFVAVNPDVLDCGADGKGTPMSITANGVTVDAVAIDKCMGCETTHIDVASAVWTALGYTFDDGGMHDNAGLSWVLSATK